MDELYGLRNSDMISHPTTAAAAAAASVDDYCAAAGGAHNHRIVEGGGWAEEDTDSDSLVLKARIAAHPLYPKLLQAYIHCRKVGAPPEVVNLLGEFETKNDINGRAAVSSSCLGTDPSLDQFMDAYCDVLARYGSDLSRPFDEAAAFLSNMETQLSHLCCNPSAAAASSRNDHSEEEAATSDELISQREMEVHDCSGPTGEDRELKDMLLRKYSGSIGTLKLQLSKKKTNGKLPREARQALLDWWSIHYSWPYPTEADKVALAKVTGLGQKQINNWFINQRKRHWKPSENMQLAVMDNCYGPTLSTTNQYYCVVETQLPQHRSRQH